MNLNLKVSCLSSTSAGVGAASCRASLRVLDVSHNELEGARDGGVLGRLAVGLPSLRVLSAGNNALGEEGGGALGGALVAGWEAAGAGGRCALESLDVSACELGSGVALGLARALVVGGVVGAGGGVNISGNGVSGVGLSRLRGELEAQGLLDEKMGAGRGCFERLVACLAGGEEEGGEEAGNEIEDIFAPPSSARQEIKLLPVPPRSSEITQGDRDAAKQACAKGLLAI